MIQSDSTGQNFIPHETIHLSNQRSFDPFKKLKVALERRGAAMHARYLLDARDIVKARAQRHARSDCSSDVLFEAAIKDGLTTGERTNIHEAAIIASGFGDVNSLAMLAVEPS